MSDIAIQFENVGKLYKLGIVGTGTLSDDLTRWWKMSVLGQEDPFLKIGESNDRTQKGKSDYVWALQNISFDIHQGDVVGIIGKNGAGKSTLLKLLSRVTTPTTGQIRAHGRIASLLEVGTGFHPELTGRENIYMNGSIMGMRKAEITRKLDEIVSFAGVERYVDTPVKRYSSGMTVRLGFAVAAFLEPEILVVDEVLAVGDAEFQKKAIGKMQDVSNGEGRTVLFVSHNMSAIRTLCKRGVLLKNGHIDYIGEASDAVDRYIDINKINNAGEIKDNITFKKDYLTINEIRLNGTTETYSTIKTNQTTLELYIEGETNEKMNCEVKMVFRNNSDTPIASHIEGRCTGNLMVITPGKFYIKKEILLPKYLSQGEYKVDIDLHQPMVQDFFLAHGCAYIHCNGNYEPFAHPTLLNAEGFYSMDSLQSEYKVF